MEEWRDVYGYEGLYEVSDQGEVRRINSYYTRRSDKHLSPCFTSGGYKRVNLSSRGVVKYHYVHRLVAEAFLGPRPEGMDINHKDGNRTNNTLENLEYLTRSQNHMHRLDVLGGREKLARGSSRWNAVLREADIPVVRYLHASGVSQKEIAMRYGVTAAAIHSIVKGKTWKHVA